MLRRRSESFNRRSVAAIPMFEPLERREMFSAGGVDFATQVNFGVAAAAHDAVVQSDGKTVVVGTTSDGRFAVARLNADHTVDATFGPNHDGKAFARLGVGSQFKSDASAVAIDHLGDILVAGTSRAAGKSYIAIVRFLPNGLVDSKFDEADSNYGFILSDLDDNQQSSASDITIDGNGKILVVGQGFNTHFLGVDEHDMIVGRFNPSGTLDESFGDGGHRFIGGSGGTTGKALTIDAHTGNIIAVGSVVGTFPMMAIARLNSQGNFDGSFNGGQTKLIGVNGRPSEANGVTLQSSGRIVVTGSVFPVAGHTNHSFATARLLASGQVDQSFGQINPHNPSVHLGWVVTSIGNDSPANDVIQGPQGGLLVCGRSDRSGGEGVVVKYTADGNLDTNIGNGGIVETIFPDHSGYARLTVGPGLRFVAVGGSLKFDVTRYLEAGARVVNADGESIITREGSNSPGTFRVFRQEQLPWPTRVYFSIGGTATAPCLISDHFKTNDYIVSGLHVNPLTGGSGYVDIPANQTFTDVTVTAVDDQRVEGDEQALFTVQNDPSYDVGGPRTIAITIKDNDLAMAHQSPAPAANTLVVANVWSELPVA